MGPHDPEPREPDEIPLGQRLYDSPFLLLILGVLVVGVFYTLWGIVEISTIPEAPLP